MASYSGLSTNEQKSKAWRHSVCHPLSFPLPSYTTIQPAGSCRQICADLPPEEASLTASFFSTGSRGSILTSSRIGLPFSLKTAGDIEAPKPSSLRNLVCGIRTSLAPRTSQVIETATDSWPIVTCLPIPNSDEIVAAQDSFLKTRSNICTNRNEAQINALCDDLNAPNKGPRTDAESASGGGYRFNDVDTERNRWVHLRPYNCRSHSLKPYSSHTKEAISGWRLSTGELKAATKKANQQQCYSLEPTSHKYPKNAVFSSNLKNSGTNANL
ncbi:unnamed protein product, partial [Protopolystoma xenopodis]